MVLKLNSLRIAFLIVLACLHCLHATAQKCDDVLIRASDRPAPIINGAGYIGGVAQLEQFITDNRRIPNTGQKGFVWVQVYIDSSGLPLRYHVENCSNGNTGKCKTEALRIVKKIPKWEAPEKTRLKDGKVKLVPVYYSVFIYF